MFIAEIPRAGLEATHLTTPKRISRLFGLLCIALAWMTRIGTQRTGTLSLGGTRAGEL